MIGLYGVSTSAPLWYVADDVVGGHSKWSIVLINRYPLVESINRCWPIYGASLR